MKRNLQTVTIETPEHFELQFQLAGIGVRFLAFLVDRVIQAGVIFGLIVIVSLLIFMSGKVAEVTDFFVGAQAFVKQWILALAILVYGVTTIGYFLLFEYFWSGTTPGKRSQHIRVIRKDGRPITFLDSSVRNILRFVDLLADVYPLGLLVMFLDSKNRRLGDIAAGTLVVVEKDVIEPFTETTPKRSAQVDPELSYAVASMTPEDYRLITRFLTRRGELDTEYRGKLAWEILHAIVDKTPRPVQVSGEPEAVLEKLQTLYMERTRVL